MTRSNTPMTADELADELVRNAREERRLLSDQARSERRLLKAARRSDRADERLESVRARLVEAEAKAEERRRERDAAAAAVAAARAVRQTGTDLITPAATPE